MSEVDGNAPFRRFRNVLDADQGFRVRAYRGFGQLSQIERFPMIVARRVFLHDKN